MRRLGAAALVFAVLAGATALAPGACCGGAGDALAWAGWLCGVALLALAAAEAFELVELGLPMRSVAPGACDAAARGLLLSVHVPICAEPPDVVERTLRALNALRHERLEVIVVDNNTADEALWRPVEQLCRQLGPRFRFFHLPRWPGYKAGALNFALARTSRDASLVAVVDSDYEVEAGFVEELIGHFDADVAFVQAPQDYRRWQTSVFARMCYWEYWQFFAVSMRLRQRRNAILMHGTMVILRKSALAGVGGWSEWCVTEDSELGLRLLAAGWRGVYGGRTLGRGLVPFSSRDYKRQRARWVTGGMQTLARHRRLFMPWNGALTRAQKLHFLQGWSPWIRDGVIVGSTPLALALACRGAWQADAAATLEPLAKAMLAVAAYLVVRQVLVYRLHLGRPWRDTIGATVAILGLVPTAGAAVIASAFGRRLAFERTPKHPLATPFANPRTVCELLAALASAALAACLAWRLGAAGAVPAAGMLAYCGFFACSVATDVLAGRSETR